MQSQAHTMELAVSPNIEGSEKAFQILTRSFASRHKIAEFQDVTSKLSQAEFLLVCPSVSSYRQKETSKQKNHGQPQRI